MSRTEDEKTITVTLRARLSKRTRLAVDLQAQASILERFGADSLDCGKLTALLRDAAKSLDGKVKPLYFPKAPAKPTPPALMTLREGEIPKRGTDR